jgi:hypothetical protein
MLVSAASACEPRSQCLRWTNASMLASLTCSQRLVLNETTAVGDRLPGTVSRGRWVGLASAISTDVWLEIVVIVRGRKEPRRAWEAGTDLSLRRWDRSPS